MNILVAKATLTLGENSRRKYIVELFNRENLLRQIPQNYVLERRFCVASRADFIGEYVRRRALDTLVRTFNVTDSRRDDKKTHRDASRADYSFISEPFAKKKKGWGH